MNYQHAALAIALTSLLVAIGAAYLSHLDIRELIEAIRHLAV